jgi:hypothetical protein
MSTGYQFTNLATKRLLGVTDMREGLLDYLRNSIHENFGMTFQQNGVYNEALTLSGPSTDHFAINGDSLATDGDGHIIDVGYADNGVAYPFENALGILYHIAMAYGELPQDVQVNPRTGYPEWIGWREIIGEKGTPNSVTATSTTMTFVIDSVAETGVTHAGRQAIIYKIIPERAATTIGVAMETCTVELDGGQNKITTVGIFGQTTISTNPSDYAVILMGPTVRRNTDLSIGTGRVYIGTVMGVGISEGPPSTFDITGQNVLGGSMSDISDITRIASNGAMKIDVKVHIGEDGEDQIRVTNNGDYVFRVDELGNTWIEGNLVVTGTTTQENLVQVNSSETITDSLTAGDADTDNHLIKGTWAHTNAAENETYFHIDGATGQVGFGDEGETGYVVKFTGVTKFTDRLYVENNEPIFEFKEAVQEGGNWRWRGHDGDYSLEEATATNWSTFRQWLWADTSTLNLITQANFVPLNDAEVNLGSATKQWNDAYINGTADIDIITLSVAADEGIGSDIYPTDEATYSLGTTGRRWLGVNTANLVLGVANGEGMGSDFIPLTNAVYDLGSLTRKWSEIHAVDFYTDNFVFTGNFNPSADLNGQQLGEETLRWTDVYSGCAHFVPGTLSSGAAEATAFYALAQATPVNGCNLSLTGANISCVVDETVSAIANGDVQVLGANISVVGHDLSGNHDEGGAAYTYTGALINATLDATNGGDCNIAVALLQLQPLITAWGSISELVGAAIEYHVIDATYCNVYNLIGVAVNPNATPHRGEKVGIMIGSMSGALTGSTSVGLSIQDIESGGSWPDSAWAIKTGVGHVSFGDSVTCGAPTGGAKGAGTINATAVYDDNALLTCYVLEAARTGEINFKEWDKVTAMGIHIKARAFNIDNLDIEKYSDYWRTNRHLPAMSDPRTWSEETRPSVGELAQQLWETVEVQAVHIANLHERLKHLENGTEAIM